MCTFGRDDLDIRVLEGRSSCRMLLYATPEGNVQEGLPKRKSNKTGIDPCSVSCTLYVFVKDLCSASARLGLRPGRSPPTEGRSSQ